MRGLPAEEPLQAPIDVLSMSMSIIVASYTMERLDDIRECVYSLLDQTWPLCEVIVAVDHNDELLQKLRAELPDLVKVVPNTGARGSSDTRNSAITQATGDIIGFVDDDTTAARDCMEKLMYEYRVRSVVGVGGRSVPAWRNGRPYWFPEELDWVVGSTYKGAPESVEQVVRLIGCNMSFRREAFEIAGTFRNDLARIDRVGEGEDSEICLRMTQRIPGSVILYQPEAVVYHKVPPNRATFKYLLRRSYGGGLAVASIKGIYSSSDEAPLATTMERSFLRYLLKSALLGRVRYAYRRQVLGQMIAIVASICATAAGYVAGRVLTRKSTRVQE